MESNVKPPSLWFELLCIVVLSILAVAISSYVDFFEKIYRWSRLYEPYQIDELFSALIVMAIGLAVFSFRRWREHLKQQLVLHELIAEKEGMIAELREATDKIRVLSGLLPICSYCKRIRSEQDHWQQLEDYISEHSEALFTHGICPACKEKLYSELSELMEKE